MSVLVCLPSVLFSIVLNDWLTSKEWLRLDSAFCNENSRHLFLEELSAILYPTFVPFNTSNLSDLADTVPSCVYHWIYNKGIRLDNYTISYLHFSNNKRLTYEVRYDCIKSLKLVGDLGLRNSLTTILSKCINVKDLVCVDFGIVGGRGVDSLGQLTSLQLLPDSYNDIQRENHFIMDLRKIYKQCNKLKTFRTFHKYSAYSQELLCQILEKNTQLVAFTASGKISLLETVLRCCPAINDILIVDCSDLNVTLLSQLIKQKPDMNSVTLMKNGETSEKVEYITHNGERYLAIQEYINQNNDLSLLIDSCNELHAFECSGPDFTPSMLQSLVSHSSKTLRRFLSEVDLIPNNLLQELLTKCKLLTDLQFSLIDDSIVEAFTDVHLDLNTIMLSGDELSLSTACTTLKVFPSLIHCRFALVSNLDVELKEFTTLLAPNEAALKNKTTCKMYLVIEGNLVTYIQE